MLKSINVFEPVEESKKSDEKIDNKQESIDVDESCFSEDLQNSAGIFSEETSQPKKDHKRNSSWFPYSFDEDLTMDKKEKIFQGFV